MSGGGMAQSDLDDIYEAITAGYDAVAVADRERYLARLVLLLLQVPPDRATIDSAIARARRDLDHPNQAE